MVFGLNYECSKCKCKESPIWERNEDDMVLCNTCFRESSIRKKKENVIEESDNDKTTESTPMDVSQSSEDIKENTKDKKDSTGNEEFDNDKDRDGAKGTGDKRDLKRRTRKGKQGGKGSVPKGKGRRYIFKKSATRAVLSVATPVTSKTLFYRGMYYQVGDIVSVVDVDGGVYYAQIRGLLQDQYCEKSAVITWLLPSKKSPPPEEQFDPSTYMIGPEEDIPRKLEYLYFVSRAPSDYYKDRTSPYATASFNTQSCFAWSKMGPVIRPIEQAKELMGK